MKRRNNPTNYRARLRLLKSRLPRLVVRKTNSMIIGQIIYYAKEGDKTAASVYSSELKSYGWNFSLKNTPASYLSGFLLGKKSSIREAILDKGSRTLKKDSFIYYFMKGASDAGMNVHTKEFDVSEGRLYGQHIMDHFNKGVSGNQFSSVGKTINNMKDEFDSVLKKLNEYGK
ncbi:MAG: 50S ribosomal protein L18 [Candidatus Parvarchaeota archaeon]|nr:50S ribosomal protein L18 [Candidatus Parvarchaeota archaeon]MCW1301992.1 50S ribosomal protein L18 [Candidatus Parvarchaeota archaeon]